MASATAKHQAGGEGAPPKKGVSRGNAGKGRRKGSQNKENKALREMILGALHEKGGVAYLAQQAGKNPSSFLSLLGRVLPMQVSGAEDAPPILHRIELVTLKK